MAVPYRVSQECEISARKTTRPDKYGFGGRLPFRDGKTAARIVRETALRVGKNLDPLAFERDMQAFVERTAGRKAADFVTVHGPFWYMVVEPADCTTPCVNT